MWTSTDCQTDYIECDYERSTLMKKESQNIAKRYAESCKEIFDTDD